MYARGILFGKMKYELGDHSFVRCPENHLVADIEFKTKGYFSGGYNAILGTIRNEHTNESLYELSGVWSGEMFIKDLVTGHRELLFDAGQSKETPPQARGLEDQDERESQKLWLKVVEALKERNHDAATDEKTRIEEMQRAEAARRAEDGVEWRPRLFRPVRGGPGGSEEGEEDLDWILNADIDGSSAEVQNKQIQAIVPIVEGSHPSGRYDIPPRQEQQQHINVNGQGVEGTRPPATQGTNDLIDFGQSDAPSIPTKDPPQGAAPSKPSDLAHTNLQQPLQPALVPSRADASGAIDASADSGNLLKRQDTEEGVTDVFMDADDGLLH
ncbi:MAG: hypothetical protein M1825_004042 [Sarcosagium campestre]|nr:MAG: hypothetical protein M1825_004042 [Sarcosagium campestre]